MATVLICVDMQLDFYSRNAAVSSAFPSLPNNIKSLTDLGRASPDVEVIHLREGSNGTESPWYSFWSQLNPGKSSAADASTSSTEDCAKDINDERVFVKFGYDGVGVDSGLVSYLEQKYSETKPTILVCGLVTSCCVHCNAAGLFLRGYPTFVVADACGDRTVEMHTNHLKRESRRCFAVVDLKDVQSVYDSNNDDQNKINKLVELSWPNFTQLEK